MSETEGRLVAISLHPETAAQNHPDSPEKLGLINCSIRKLQFQFLLLYRPILPSDT
jgi:hypothetical protein